MAEISIDELWAEIGRLTMTLKVEQREKEQAFTLLQMAKTENDDLRARLSPQTDESDNAPMPRPDRKAKRGEAG